MMMGMIGPSSIVAGGVTLSLDGSAHAAPNATNIVTMSLTTTKTNDIIYVMSSGNGSDVSIVGSTLGAFTRRGGGGSINGYWVLASSILTGEVITITYSGGATFVTGSAVAVNGAKTSAPFDVNGSIPTLTAFGVPADPFSITTSAANTILIGGFGMNGTSNPTAGAGWTAFQLNGDFLLTETKIVSAAGSNSITIGTGVSDSKQGFGDAIVQGP